MDAIHLAPTIALPTQQGSHGIALPAGQTIQAVVLAILENNVARIQLPQAIFDIQSSVPLQQGAHLTLALQGSGAQAKLVILASDIPAQAAPTGQPIGEATILGRVLPSAMRAAAPPDSPPPLLHNAEGARAEDRRSRRPFRKPSRFRLQR